MRKKLLSFVALAAIVFFGACSNEELLPEPEQEQTFTFSASMPQKKSPTSSIALNDPTTRVALEEVDKDIVLTWETDDILEVVATQIDGTILGTGTANIIPESISSDGKKAKFTTSAPLPTGTFNFYGVYGGRGLSGTNALLPIAPSTSGSLEEVEDNKDVMLYFAHEGVSQADLQNGVTFNHLGSLFKITVQNNCTTGTLNLQQGAELIGINNSDAEDWAYDFSTQGTLFNLTSEEFENTGIGVNSISFNTNTTSIGPNGDIAEYWSWYPVLEGNTWPALRLTLNGAVGDPAQDLTTTNNKTRATPIVAGMNYRFYASFDGTDLNFITSIELKPEPEPEPEPAP